MDKKKKLKVKMHNACIYTIALAAYFVLCGAVAVISAENAGACLIAYAMIGVLFCIGYANHFWDNPNNYEEEEHD